MSIVVENILKILKNKSLSKKEFALRLINLEPKVGIKSEPPSERTIYLYLQEKREIKVDLIPYIAEVLNVKEQELFNLSYIDKEDVLKKHTNFSSKISQKEELISLLPKIPKAVLSSFIQISKEFSK